jgi:hypothetical protein
MNECASSRGNRLNVLVNLCVILGEQMELEYTLPIPTLSVVPQSPLTRPVPSLKWAMAQGRQHTIVSSAIGLTAKSLSRSSAGHINTGLNNIEGS